jgi:hypothetical protein
MNNDLENRSHCRATVFNLELLTVDGIKMGLQPAVTDYVQSPSRFHWLRGIRHGFMAAGLLELQVLIPPGVWMSLVSVVCCQI